MHLFAKKCDNYTLNKKQLKTFKAFSIAEEAGGCLKEMGRRRHQTARSASKSPNSGN